MTPLLFSHLGDPYPLQLIPTTMAAAAAATPGLGPLQLQVRTPNNGQGEGGRQTAQNNVNISPS